ncbi:hypothetical protein [Pseudofrankia inefficax]|uniref:Uncharacterized protein n=1 Tax=Pseudofrankia inefficax (strain DSM 45817 / CECT 9037 / DDB 130130 / EuI1c) TaxID=298654 RepID=E3J2H5_PSEI1|nr:hypothetical protein [Pseudofrankia inefficax]ADP79347.1 hypothetical protein FraEuI1c_1275 [Pseudofrankia inefficax]
MLTSPPKRSPVSTPTRALHAGAALLLVAAAPVAVAGLLGQDDYQGVPRSELDYAVRPLDIPPGRMTALGIAALLLMAAITALLLHEARRGTADRRLWQVVCPLVGVGVVFGFGYHVATAGVIGANIGYGLVVFFGVPLVAALILVAAARAWALRAKATRRTL